MPLAETPGQGAEQESFTGKKWGEVGRDKAEAGISGEWFGEHVCLSLVGPKLGEGARHANREGGTVG